MELIGLLEISRGLNKAKYEYKPHSVFTYFVLLTRIDVLRNRTGQVSVESYTYIIHIAGRNAKTIDVQNFKTHCKIYQKKGLLRCKNRKHILQIKKINFIHISLPQRCFSIVLSIKSKKSICRLTYFYFHLLSRKVKLFACWLIFLRIDAFF